MIWLVCLTLCVLVGCTANEFFGIRLKGKSHSHAGNKSDKQVLESYIVDPHSLPAFQMYVEPILDNLDDQFEGPKQQGVVRWSKVWTYKTWYIAPVQFRTIPREVLGVSFSRDQSQQLAIQTAQEIWIQKSLFDQMSYHDQADLIIHELVMSLYFLKYKSLFEICSINASKGALPLEDCWPFKWLDEIFPGANPLPLNAMDYQNIRRVTGFFVREGATASSKAFFETLSTSGFDSRLFPVKDTPLPPEDFSITGEKLNELFITAQLANRMPYRCTFLSSDREVDCSVKTYPVIAGSIKSVDLIMHEGKNRIYLGHYSNNPLVDYVVSADYNPLTNNVIYSVPLGSGSPARPVVGEHFRFILLIATGSERDRISPPEIQVSGLVSVSGVITKVEKSRDGKRCTAEILTPGTPQEDTIVAGQNLLDMAYLKWLSRHMGIPVDCN